MKIRLFFSLFSPKTCTPAECCSNIRLACIAVVRHYQIEVKKEDRTAVSALSDIRNRKSTVSAMQKVLQRREGKKLLAEKESFLP